MGLFDGLTSTAGSRLSKSRSALVEDFHPHGAQRLIKSREALHGDPALAQAEYEHSLGPLVPAR